MGVHRQNNCKSFFFDVPSASTSLIMSCSSASVGFWPSDLITVPNSLVVMVPSPSLSNSEKASLNSAICSSVNWSAYKQNAIDQQTIAGPQCSSSSTRLTENGHFRWQLSVKRVAFPLKIRPSNTTPHPQKSTLTPNPIQKPLTIMMQADSLIWWKFTRGKLRWLHCTSVETVPDAMQQTTVYVPIVVCCTGWAVEGGDGLLRRKRSGAAMT